MPRSCTIGGDDQRAPTHLSGLHPTTLSAEYTSSSFGHAIQRLHRFAMSGQAAVLIEGESGTGKTTLARQFHAWSVRRRGPFHAVTLSTLDDGVAASELFGHVAGAFTDARHQRRGCFASAEHGTLFLDEIGKASKALQQKLLHVIETGEFRPVGSDTVVRVDVRVIAATNISLEELVREHGFLPDLRARLGYFRVQLPPLRKRRADIPRLVNAALSRHAPSYSYDQAPAVEPSLLAALCRAPWPDNLRELDATVQRLLVDAEGAKVLTPAHCYDDLEYLADLAREGERKRSGSERLTAERVAAVMASVPEKCEAARILGVDRTTLHRYLKRTRSSTAAMEPRDSNVSAVSTEGEHPVMTRSDAAGDVAPQAQLTSAPCGANSARSVADKVTPDVGLS